MLALVLALGCSHAATREQPQAANGLFLLAGTATNESSEGYPVTLYTVGSTQKLKEFRQVATKEEGVFEVQYDFGDNLYVSYPSGSSTTVSVIHMKSPSTVDEVEFNPKRLITLYGFGGVAAGGGRQSYALYLLLAAGAPRESATLLSVAGTAIGRQPRVTTNEWDRYKSIRFEGCSGGPAYCLWPELQVAAGKLLMGVKPKQIEISAAPPAISNVKGPERFKIVAASPRFLTISPWYKANDLASSAIRTTRAYVQDRVVGNWKKITILGNRSRSRLFGAWLATVLQNWNPANSIAGGALTCREDQNPGRENERLQPNQLLPSVNMEYSSFEGSCNIIPGILILDNLEDGRRITLQTNQEDSEILDVRSDGLVLYRVNDSIFSAQIEGDKLSAPTLVVKDDDVPEVHWAFWSNAKVETKAKPKTPLVAVLAAGASNQGGPFTLTLVAPKQPLKAGQPLILRVTVKNASQRPIDVPVSEGSYSVEMVYQVHVLDERGRPALPWVFPPRANGKIVIGMGMGHGMGLQPGQSLTDEVNIGHVYDVTRPGKYKIWIAGPYYRGPDILNGIVKSNTITVTVAK